MAFEEMLEQIKMDGYCIVREVIPYDRVETIRQSLEETALEQGRRQGPKMTLRGSGDSGNDRIEKYPYGPTHGLLSLNQSFAPYLTDERILSVLRAFWGPHVRITWIICHFNPPGFQRGVWHADQPFNQTPKLRVFAPYPDAVIQLSSVWMLSAFTPDAGATWIAPGSHRTNNNPTGDNGVDGTKPYPGEKQAIGNAGDMLLYDSRLWHAGGTNHCDKPRFGLAVRYSPWWFNMDYLLPLDSPEKQRLAKEVGVRPEELGAVPTMPKEVYESLPEKLKPLVLHAVR